MTRRCARLRAIFAEKRFQAPPAPDSLHEERDESEWLRNRRRFMASARKLGARLDDCNARAVCHSRLERRGSRSIWAMKLRSFLDSWLPVLAWMAVTFFASGI